MLLLISIGIFESFMNVCCIIYITLTITNIRQRMLIRSCSTSSFSSFSSNQYPPTSEHYEPIPKIRTQKTVIRPSSCAEMCEFQAFEQKNITASLQKFKQIEQASFKTIMHLREEIGTLKAQNEKLLIANIKLKSQVERLRVQKHEQQQMLVMKSEAEEKQARKQRTQHFLKETLKIKQTMHSVKLQCQKYRTLCADLQAKLGKYEKQGKQCNWKDNFVMLFIDMLCKISNDIDPQWSTKKKIQVGWKIVKYLIQKAFLSGIKPPRVERYNE